MSDMEKICICAMNSIFGYEPEIAHRIINSLGSASALFGLNGDELRELFGPFSKYSGRICQAELDKAARELKEMSRTGAEFISIADGGYPPLLRECCDAPVGLYVRSCSRPEELFLSRPCIAIVGTRGLSSYGREWCRRIVGAMAQSPSRPCIVSGMAIGTDICAHEAALEAGLTSIGVMPSGLDDIFPARHRGFAEKMAATAGCALVSDYPPRTGAAKVNFVRRNRIIAGICSATILIESKSDGGGMITARLASSYDRDVFALPGKIDEPLSQGCNQLIREKIAEAITDMDLLMESLGLGQPARRKNAGLRSELAAFYKDRISPETLEKVVGMCLDIKKHRDIDMTELAAAHGLSVVETTRICTMLETDGFISIDLLQRCSIQYKIS